MIDTARFTVLAGVLSVSGLGAAPVGGQVTFTDVTVAAGLTQTTAQPGPPYMATGAAAADFDDDGWVDLFLPAQAGAPDLLYHNLGGGQFVEIAASAGVASTRQNVGGLWLDYDGDHDLDLLVTSQDQAAPVTLYEQTTPGVFVDVTAAAGLSITLSPPAYPTNPRHRSGAAAGDINHDGYLDVCVTIWNGEARLFVNNTDKTLTEVSTTSGINALPRNFWQPFFIDLDRDGWLDLYLLVDKEQNQLWINQKDGTFVEAAGAARLNNNMTDMGLSFGDYDNDGDFDLYITNIYVPADNNHNVLFRNDTSGGILFFTDVSAAAGVDYGGWGWGTTFFDADRDGWLDIGATNGWWTTPFNTDASRFFHNPGVAPFAFADDATTSGFDDARWGSSLVAFDYDRDGDRDLLQTCMNEGAHLAANQPVGIAANNHYLTVKPRMLGPNHRAIGATVTVAVGGLTMMRLITAGTSCIGQEPAEAFFGLASADKADTLIIDWPDGTQTSITDAPADQVLTVTHGGFGDLDADGDVDTADYAIFEACITGPGNGSIIYAPGCQAADINADGAVDLADFARIAPRFP